MWEVEHGAVIISTIDKLHEGDGFMAFTLDLTTKYAEATPQMGTSSPPALHLLASAASLKMDARFSRFRPTILKMPAKYAGWWMVADMMARYTVNVAVFAPDYDRIVLGSQIYNRDLDTGMDDMQQVRSIKEMPR